MPINRNLPTVEEVRQLPVHLTLTVPPEWEDRNGHVNVQYYQALYELAGWKILEDIGIDERYLAGSEGSLFDLEHHTRFLAEIHVGEEVSMHNRMLGKSDKLFHGMLFIINDTNQRLACTIEYLSIYIDFETRRSATFPRDMALRLDGLLRDHSAISWQVSTCGQLDVQAG